MSNRNCRFKSCFAVVFCLTITVVASIYLFYRYALTPGFDPKKRLYVSDDGTVAVLFLYDDLAVRRIRREYHLILNPESQVRLNKKFFFHDSEEISDPSKIEEIQEQLFYDLGRAYWTGYKDYPQLTGCRFKPSKNHGKNLDALYVDSDRKVIIGKDGKEYFHVRERELHACGTFENIQNALITSGITNHSLFSVEYYFTNKVFASKPRGAVTNCSYAIPWMDCSRK